MDFCGLAHPVELLVGERVFLLGLAPSVKTIIILSRLLPRLGRLDFLPVHEALATAFPLALRTDAIAVAVGAGRRAETHPRFNVHVALGGDDGLRHGQSGITNVDLVRLTKSVQIHYATESHKTLIIIDFHLPLDLRVGHPAHSVFMETVAVEAHFLLEMGQACAGLGERAGGQVFVFHFARVAAVPETLGKGHYAVNHAVVQRDVLLFIDAHIFPKAEDTAQSLGGVGRDLCGGGVEEEAAREQHRVVIIQIADKRVQILPCLFGCGGVGACGLVPNLANDLVGSGQSRVPCDGLAVIFNHQCFNPLHKALRVFNPDFIGADMEIGTVAFRDFGEELVQALFKHFLAILGVHREAESVLEIG